MNFDGELSVDPLMPLLEKYFDLLTSECNQFIFVRNSAPML